MELGTQVQEPTSHTAREVAGTMNRLICEEEGAGEGRRREEMGLKLEKAMYIYVNLWANPVARSP